MINDEYILNNFLNKRNQINSLRLKHINDEEYNYLINRFNDNENNNLLELIYRIKYKIEEIPKCKICGNKTYFRNSSIGYSLTCSKKCNYDLIFKTYKETCLKKYGVDNVAKSEIVKEKAKETCLKKYGKLNGFNKEKAKETYLKHFGVDHNFKSIENRNIAKETSINKYVNYNNKDKKNKTNIERYGGKSPMHSNKVKENHKKSLKNKYGCEYALQNKKIYNKMIETKNKNNSWVSSKFEEDSYKYLLSIFNENDIFRQYKDDRYKNPITKRNFLTDFYIKSIDLFIEIQGFYSHGTHPYDPNDINDQNELKKLIIKDKNNKIPGKNLYSQKIYGWTIWDPLKRKIAKENNLNYLEAWNIEELKNKLQIYLNEI